MLFRSRTIDCYTGDYDDFSPWEQRFLDGVKTKPDLKPGADWDGSVISLMNYPDIVKMMSDDLDWTQVMGEAITNQQKDVLVAIQQLREKAVAEGNQAGQAPPLPSRGCRTAPNSAASRMRATCSGGR